MKVAEDHLVLQGSMIFLGHMTPEKEDLRLQLGALINFLAGYHLGIKPKSGCQFLHLRWRQWNQFNDLLLSILLSRQDGTTPEMVLMLDLSRCITIGSQDGEGQETIITRSRMKIRGRGDHNVMRATIPTIPTILMLSKEDLASGLRDQKGRLRELRELIDQTEPKEWTDQIGQRMIAQTTKAERLLLQASVLLVLHWAPML
jgi:hypothetical protein